MIRRPPRSTLFPPTPPFRSPIGTILADPVTHELFRGTSEEVEAVARAGAVRLPADCVEQAMATAAAVEPWGRDRKEHTSELQSRQYLVCRLLLEKKKNKL